MFTNPKPKCVQCEVVESLLWRSLDNGHICYNCFEENTNNKKKAQESAADVTDEVTITGSGNAEDSHQLRVRKSTRSTRYKAKGGGGSANGGAGSANAGPQGGVGSGNGGATVGNNSNGTAGGGGGGGSKGAPKGRSRRNMFKKVPTKTPTATATTTCVESLFYNVYVLTYVYSIY